MKPLNWVELTRQQIKARHGFGWSIQGIEKQNKVLTKIVYRFSTGGRTTVLTDIEWNTNNSKKIQDLIIEFETLMEERHVDLKKAYELIVGNKVFTDKKNINWEVLVNEFVNEERGNRRDNEQSQKWISYHNENKPERPFSDPEVNTLLDKLSN